MHLSPALRGDSIPEGRHSLSVRPGRVLLLLLAGAVAVATVLVSQAARGYAPGWSKYWDSFAFADSDSVAVNRDSTLTDSTKTDSTALSDTSRVDKYFRAFKGDRPVAALFDRSRPMMPRMGSFWRHELKLDSTGRYYISRELVGDKDVRFPLRLDYESYRQARLARDMRDNWHSILEQQQRMRNQQQRGGLGFDIVVPGGRQSAFSTIFGKPGVSLRVTGQAYITAGFDYRKSQQQVNLTGRASRTDPTFKQDLSLGITGTIGDKMQVDVSWDTKNQFDYQNQLKLRYTGHEDEIIKSIEAGNVFLDTPSTLIRGGQSLFGIKSEFQVGGIQFTTVASQQEGQSNSLAIEGGSQTTEFELKPTDYDQKKHFFLGYYFRNRWEDALQSPPQITLHDGFIRIEDIEVWKLQYRTVEQPNERQAVALVDLGEPHDLVSQANNFTTPVLPGEDVDQYLDEEIDQFITAGTTTPDTYLMTQKNLSSSDFQVGRFTLLREGSDYDLDPQLGYISLSQTLQDNEALAVAYRLTTIDGTVHTIGQFASETGGSSGSQNDKKLLLKLLRPQNLKQPAANFNPAAWYLELRNIYPLRSLGISSNEFELTVEYEPPGKTPAVRLPGVGGTRTLLQILGLDRWSPNDANRPDNEFDYIRGYTINEQKGLLIFPYLEPFGSHLAEVIESSGSGDAQQNKNLYVFDRLYREEKELAVLDKQRDVYLISVSYKGQTQSHYDLGAYAGLIPGSVKVTSGGTPLTEGTDFVVDYTSGTVDITNPAYLTAGRNIQITYEQNQFLNLQKKTLIGAMARYQLDDRLILSTTLMRLHQKSPVDKLRVGEEPVSNLIWGTYGKIDLQPRWLTRAVDALPFIQTKEPSTFSLTGEFAQLRPSHTETIAFERTRRNLREAGRDFHADELRGISYLDDFEGFETTYSLKQPGAWQLSSPPDSIYAIDPVPGDPDIHVGTEFAYERSKWRGSLAWYQTNRNILSDLGVSPTPATRPVLTEEVFPNRDTQGEVDPVLPTLDFFFSPRERGPYNYTTNLPEFFQNPKLAWGGVTQRLPEGYNNFNLKNIEFIEFVFRPFVENATDDAGADAKLYVDLGSISEDVIPNGKINSEDGLSTTSFSESDFDAYRRSRLPQIMEDRTVNINPDTRLTEDLGLDGLASYAPDKYRQGNVSATEQDVFTEFLDALNRDASAINDPLYQAEIQKALADPSGDDYHYFGSNYFNDSRFYPQGASLQQRFSRYFAGLELNSYEGQSELSGSDQPIGNSRFPDTEDLDFDGSVNSDNSYYQYEVPLSKAVLTSQASETAVDDYVVTEITGASGEGTGWYQVRIPVRDFTRRVGNIQDFNLIESIRIWTTGHESPITVRFASFELVGSQWRKSEDVPLEPLSNGVLPDTTSKLTISSINNEENANIYSPPNGTIISQIRLATGIPQDAREQAMVLRVEDLSPGQQRAIYKTFQGFDLLKYENLRLFVHMHGTTGDGRDLVDLAKENLDAARSKARLFIRLGANETNDYYEYEQPLTPGPFPFSPNPNNRPVQEIDNLWQTNQLYNGNHIDLNSVVIAMGAFNRLKVARDEFRTPEGFSFPQDSIFWNADMQGIPISDQVPDASVFAPPGTRLGIKGTPSLSRINTIVIGIRNPADPNSMDPSEYLDDVEVWINELRVAGYDEVNGRAALFNTDLKLADLGRVKASLQWQEDGFGGLSSTLDEREQQAFLNWGINADMNLDTFIPERFGWNLPVSVQVQSNTTTPRFAPSRGDVRLEEIIQGIEDSNADPAEKEFRKQEAIQSAQTANVTRSFSARISKQGSESKLLRNTIDGLTASYSFTDTDASNPSLRTNDSWRWSSSINYNFTARPRTVRPFWFLEPIPILSMLGDLRFNYLPGRITAAGTASRNFSQAQDRDNTSRLDALEDSTQIFLPDLVERPLREQHNFAHRRQFGIQYNPFQFLSLSLDTGTDQSLSTVGADTLYSVILRNSDGGFDAPIPNMTLEQALLDGLIDSSDVDLNAFEISRLDMVPTGNVLNRLFSGRMSPRTDQYTQRFTIGFQPRFPESLNWINLQQVSYNVNYSWRNGSVGRNTGANVGTQAEIRGGLTIRPQEFWRKFDFYKNLEQKQREAESKAQAERQQREQERQRRREEARRAKENAENERLAREDSSTVEEEAPQLEGEAPITPEQDQAAESQPDEEGGGFKLPLPNPGGIFRRTVLALTGINDISISYSSTQSSNSTNVGRPDGAGGVITYYSMLDALRGYGPAVGYRFGLKRRIKPWERVFNSSVQVSDMLTNTNRLQARTSLQPSRNLQISLNWNTDWTDRLEYTYRQLETGSYSPIQSESGTNRSYVWAFGASYLEFFEKQFAAYRDDYEKRDPTKNEFGDTNGDGRVVLTNQSVVSDFMSSFVRSLGNMDGRGLLPFPLPQWSVSYSGISNWPIFRLLVQSAQLQHNYGAEYSTDFRTNISTAGGRAPSFQLGGHQILFDLPHYEVGSVRVNERYSPLIGLNLSFKNRLSTNISWNKMNSYSLSATNFEVGENRTDEIAVSLNYQKQGMRLPLFGGKRLNNRLGLSMTLSYSENSDLRYLLRPALEDAALAYTQGTVDFKAEDAISGDNMTVMTDTKRLMIAPKIQYTFSNQVTADFTMRYERFQGDSRIPSYTAISGNFNINVRISN